MQQAIYNNSTIRISDRATNAAKTTGAGTGVIQWIARRWELVGVLALLGSSAVYGAFALTHLA